MAKTVTMTLDEQPATIEQTAAPKLGLTDKVATKSGEYTIQELLEAKHQLEEQGQLLKQYESYRGAVQNLLNTEVEDPSVREASLRFVLDQEGYSPEEIERQVGLLSAGQAAPEVDDGSGEEETVTLKQQTPSSQQRQRFQPAPDESLARLQAQIAENEKVTNQLRVSLLKREMGTSVARVLDSDPEIAKLVQKVKEFNGDEADKRVGFLRDDIEKRAVEQLSKKVALTGQRVQDAWVDEAVKSAAKEVQQRSLFGNPDLIGRAPTTDSSTDMFTNKKPVPAPTFKQGDNMATVETKVREFGTDLLSRLAANANAGESKA